MFTGIVEACSKISAIEPCEKGTRLNLELPADWKVKLGDSIAINGCCLTIDTLEGSKASFVAIPETLRLTNLGDLKPGTLVNLERAMMLGERLDGHIVQGHVDSCAPVEAIEEEGEECRVRVRAGAEFCLQCIHKGSVCIDGISLTIAELDDESFVVAIIPHTWQATNLHTRKAGERVNLEADLIGKYVRRAVGRTDGHSTPPG